MKIAVASGKGGTGKTTIATSLAATLSGWGVVWYLDCDVEAPNGHLFLDPILDQSSPAVINIPCIDVERCSLCGICAAVCQFHAMVRLGKKILVFPQLCHGCGSCSWNCPMGAIREIQNEIGTVQKGLTPEGVCFGQGQLTVGEPMPAPVIRQLKKSVLPAPNAMMIVDAPPGASCAVVESVRGCDFVLLVCEPSPFGLHDLRQMVGIVKEMGIPAGAIINREQYPFLPLIQTLKDHEIPVLLRIPFDRRIAEGTAGGLTLPEIDPVFSTALLRVFSQIEQILAVPTHEQTI
jgi:MinD superfamily P-loop ATPase